MNHWDVVVDVEEGFLSHVLEAPTLETGLGK